MAIATIYKGNQDLRNLVGIKLFKKQQKNKINHSCPVNSNIVNTPIDESSVYRLNILAIAGTVMRYSPFTNNADAATLSHPHT